MTIIAQGRLQRSRTIRYRPVKGYSRNRTDYDRRRRAHRDSGLTIAYKAILRGDPCVLCGKPIDGVTDIDHIVGLDRGGEDSWENMAPMDAPCNRGVKKDRTLLEALLLASDG
ncbi:MAG TPA: HNH endonuclease [Solirubrobacterales bacterium]